MVYRMKASQGQDKTYRYHLCDLDYHILDFEDCEIDSCLDCDNLPNCDLLRAKYERKKAAIQLARYKQDEERAKQKETREFTEDQLLDMIKPYESEYLEGDVVNQRMLRVLFKEKLGIRVSNNKAYMLKGIVETRIKNI
ncbi:MAG: hypothetical protein ACFFDT_19525 [Candidatus Hodarchaeota archaeon]